MQLLPGFIYRRIVRRPNLTRIVDNIAWLFIDRIVRLSVGLVVSIWIARYLGPEQFGQFTYAVAFVAMFGAMASLGLQGIVVRDVVALPEHVGSTLGAAFGLQLAGGVATMALLMAATAVLQQGNQTVQVLVAILSASMIFKASEVIKYWFEAKVQSRYAVWVENAAFFVVSGVRVVLILADASIIAFAWVTLVEVILASCGLVWVYLQHEEAVRPWHFHLDRAVSLLRAGWPMIFMTLMLGLYTKIDIFMVEHFLGWEATGIYSAALRVAEAWYFVAVILTSSLYPALIAARERSLDAFKSKLAAFYSLMFWIPFVVSASFVAVSPTMMAFLYGDAYTGVEEVFSIYVWSSVFVFVIMASSRWFLIHNSTRSLMYRAVLGAVTNVVLNYYLLTLMGLTGAALSTLISYVIVAYFYDMIDPKAYGQIYMKLRAPVYPYLWFLYERRRKAD